jgi:hypothetical protein
VNRIAEHAQRFGEQSNLRGFTAAFRALERDEQTFRHLRFTIYDLRADQGTVKCARLLKSNVAVAVPRSQLFAETVSSVDF